MIWGIKEGVRVKATPREKSICPICNEGLIAKCGKIKIWHWSHISKKDCDEWAEPDSEWHLTWQNKFPKEWQEVRIENHRADIKTEKGIVIEIQNSSLSPNQITQREEFYQNMIWLLNGQKLAKGIVLKKSGEFYTFRWKNPPKSFWRAKKPIFVDLTGCSKYIYIRRVGNMYNDDYNSFNGKILLIKKIYQNIPCGGWGIIMTKEDFVKKWKN